MGLPSELPILPLLNAVVYPHMVMPLHVGQPRSLRLLEAVLAGDKLLGLAAQRDPEQEEPPPGALYAVGTAAVIHKMLKMPDGGMSVLVQGLARVKLGPYTRETPFLVARITPLEDVTEDSQELRALASSVSDQFQRLVQGSTQLPDELVVAAINADNPGILADIVAANVNVPLGERQKLLETTSVRERLRELSTLLGRELEVIELRNKIESDVRGEMGKVQREHILREQLKAIQRELGEGDERQRELDELGQQIAEAKMPEEVEKVALKELDRMRSMPPAAAEYSVIRTYLDWLISLPWAIRTPDSLDLRAARRILDEDHYDLDRIKDRMLEYLAVRRLNPAMKGPILCFVGPPGVGKTSLGRSIARALGRKFVRMSLGGVRDEAEIRGHRRTYVGALPGRILQALRQAGSMNPVFMLDEVDKLGMDFRGDPSSALLEVLDPEQNFSFSDHYLEVAFDLSQVMFITTANFMDPIPPALRDRMEVIDLVGYTEDEKCRIARRHLLPRQLEQHGLTTQDVTLSDGALRSIIRNHTREAGVRNLEREIGSICRKVARAVAESEPQKPRRPHQVSARNLHRFLGPPRFEEQVHFRTDRPGVATGLAATAFGGEVIFIESTMMRGRGEFTLTGQLGEVMQESARAALSYLRSRAGELGIDDEVFRRFDIHLHVPAGAVPKDGPSAGITMATSLASLLMGRRVRAGLAMTGEVTLTGKVLPVGGIKDKLLAAHRVGLRTIILPKQNARNLEELPADVRRALEFVLVEDASKVLEVALGEGEGTATAENPEPAKQAA